MWFVPFLGSRILGKSPCVYIFVPFRFAFFCLLRQKRNRKPPADNSIPSKVRRNEISILNNKAPDLHLWGFLCSILPVCHSRLFRSGVNLFLALAISTAIALLAAFLVYHRIAATLG